MGAAPFYQRFTRSVRAAGCVSWPRGVCRSDTTTVTQLDFCAVSPVSPAALFLASGFAQDAYDEDYHVFTDAPRLLLTKQRLRLLQRERDRQSMRWLQFDALVSGGAPMPEQGLAWALYYQVAKNQPSGRKAVEWAVDDKHTDARPARADFRLVLAV